MTINYEILNCTEFNAGNPSGQGNGLALPLPVLPAKAHGQRLALDTASATITGPCEIIVVADENVWLDCQPADDTLDPTASALKLIASQPRAFRLLKGTYKLRGTAA
jgi:hypothetical protein